MPRTIGGQSYTQIPDTGSRVPVYCRFRKPFIKFKLQYPGKHPIILPNDSYQVLLRFYPLYGVFINGERIYTDISVRTEWYRISYIWYGIEFDEETVEAAKEIKEMEKYLRTRDVLKRYGSDKTLKAQLVGYKKQYDRIKGKYF